MKTNTLMKSNGNCYRSAGTCILFAVMLCGTLLYGDPVPANMIPGFSNPNLKGIPADYEFKSPKENAVIKTEKSIVKVVLAKPGSFFLDTPNTYKIGMKPGKKYKFTLQVKITDMKIAAGDPHAFMIYCYNTVVNKYIQSTIQGNGSTDGWITMQIIIDTVAKPELIGSRIFLRAYNVTGTFELKTPTFTEIPSASQLKTGYIPEKGEQIDGNFIKISALAKKR